MTTTRIAPSRSATVTLRDRDRDEVGLAEVLLLDASRPAGSAAPRRSSASSICAVSSSVLAPGCFCTERITAGRSGTRPCRAAARRPRPRSPRRRRGSAAPSRARTTAAATSSGWRARPSPRTRYSCPPSTWKPAAGLRLARAAASSTLVERDAVLGERLGPDRDLELPHLAADRHHLRHARDREQVATHHGLGEPAQLHRRHAVGRSAR